MASETCEACCGKIYRFFTYLRCTCRCFEFVNPCLFCCLPECLCCGFQERIRRRKAFKDLQPGALSDNFAELLRDGQMFAALVLSTSFSEKYKGKHLKKGAEAELALPAGLQHSVWKVTLFERYGIREATPFIWFGDVEHGDKTLYVAFGPLRNKRQYFKLLSQGTHLVDDKVRSSDGTEHDIRITGYMKRLLDYLWFGDCNFAEDLAKVAAGHSNMRIIFSGISHGAALAQAAGLRFALQYADIRSRVFVVNWNAYKWTDANGRRIAEQVLGERLLPLVLSARTGTHRRWDSVPEFPPGLSPMSGSLLLDVNSGEFFSNLVLGDARANFNFCFRLMELHFAKAAIGAMKVAMERDRTGRVARSRTMSAMSPFRGGEVDYFRGESFHDKVDGESDDEVQSGSNLELTSTGLSSTLLH